MVDQILNYHRNPEEDYYTILGVDELSTTAQIQTEFKCKVLKCHPDKHPDNSEAMKQFKMIQRAKEVLTDPLLRKHYDNWQRSGIAMDFEAWLANKQNVKMSMHWRGSESKKPMLDNQSAENRGQMGHNSVQKHENQWQSHDSNLLRQFRQYKI